MTVKELIEVLDEELESKEIYIFDDYVSNWRTYEITRRI